MTSLNETVPAHAGTEGRASSSINAGRADHGLRRDAAGGLEVFAQGIAAAAPSVAVAAVPAQIFLVAGNASIWAAVIGGVVVLLISYLISMHARRTVSSGSLGTYVGNGLGPGAAFATGWALLIGYIGFATAGLFGGVLYVNDLLSNLGIDTTGHAWRLGVLLIVAIPAIALPYRGVRLSARVALFLELISLLAIAVILIATVATFGVSAGLVQFSTGDIQSSILVIGAVLSVGSYAGFESVASLGFEAKNPHRTIARVVVRTVILLGILYLIATYIEVLNFTHGATPLTVDSAPLPTAARNAGVDWVVYLVDIGIAVGMIAFSAAVLSAGARSLFTLAKEGVVPRHFAGTHDRYQSPHVAILVLGLIALVFGVIGSVSDIGRLLFETYLTTVATWGYLTAYLLVAISTPLYLRRIQAQTPVTLVVSVVTIAAILLVIYKNLVPVPAWPFSILPYAFLVVLALGLSRYWYLLRTDPARAKRVGELQELSEEELQRLAALGQAGNSRV